MRRDLIIGLLCSILLHGGLGWGGNISFSSKTKKVAKEEAPTIELMELPKMEPEPPELQEDGDVNTDTTTIAPPSLVDVPSAVSIDSIVQAVQPPPPPKANISNVTPNSALPSTSGLKDVFDLKNLDQVPVLRNQLRLTYPFEMKRLGLSGEVVLEFICDNQGDVRDPVVVRSTRREFETAALEAIRQLKFRPGRKGGKAVSTRMQQSIVFNLEE